MSTFNKHTPGPFLVEGTTVYALEFDSWRGGKELMRNRIYANVQGYRDTPKEELEAVATLFAAAPELLEALEKLIDAVSRNSLSDVILCKHRAVDLIAKVTGE
jgi:hypothetical protein